MLGRLKFGPNVPGRSLFGLEVPAASDVSIPCFSSSEISFPIRTCEKYRNYSDYPTNVYFEVSKFKQILKLCTKFAKVLLFSSKYFDKCDNVPSGPSFIALLTAEISA